MSSGGGTGSGGGAATSMKLAIIPQKFSGEDEECSREFIESFEQAASSNNWTQDICVIQFPNYLIRTAAKWWRAYKNATRRAAATAPTWKEIQDAFLSAFASSGILAAELRLDTRKQFFEENPEQYVFDIISLCDKVDAGMSNERRVRFLLRNMDEFYLSRIMPLDPKTPQDVLVHMRRVAEIETLTYRGHSQQMRAFPVAGESTDCQHMMNMMRQLQKLAEVVRTKK